MKNLSAMTLLMMLWLFCAAAHAGQTDPAPAWPLCGRITANPPAGWLPTQGCPAARFGTAAYSDAPLSATFGPRPLDSENNRYDFHRGVDIATAIGTPIFAISDGLVQLAGVDAGYTDPVIKIRHFRPGKTSCTSVGCYYSLYLHVNDWVVAAGATVTKGQLIGHTGASSASGFAHLHFEVRDAPATDPNSAWSRDAIHPLRVLPYSAANNSSVIFGAVDTSNAAATKAVVTITSNRFDLATVEMRVFDSQHNEIVQPGNTPNAKGYYVLPPFFDMEACGFQYSHKDSVAFPWSSYGIGGVNECPYAAAHGISYNENVHTDAQSPLDFHQGLFNGVKITTQKYWPSNVSNYWLQLEFLSLKGPAACLEATAVFVSGASQTGKWGACTPPPPNVAPVASITSSCTGLQCSFSGAASSDSDGNISSYAWAFGDGSSGIGVNASHTYAQTGTFIATLTVTDNSGATGSTQKSVAVQANNPIVVTLASNAQRNAVKVSWTGATGSTVDIRRNGTLLVSPKNTGSWTDKSVSKGVLYKYKVCQRGSTSLCSAEVSLTL